MNMQMFRILFIFFFFLFHNQITFWWNSVKAKLLKEKMELFKNLTGHIQFFRMPVEK